MSQEGREMRKRKVITQFIHRLRKHHILFVGGLVFQNSLQQTTLLQKSSHQQRNTIHDLLFISHTHSKRLFATHS